MQPVVASWRITSRASSGRPPGQRGRLSALTAQYPPVCSLPRCLQDFWLCRPAGLGRRLQGSSGQLVASAAPTESIIQLAQRHHLPAVRASGRPSLWAAPVRAASASADGVPCDVGIDKHARIPVNKELVSLTDLQAGSFCITVDVHDNGNVHRAIPARLALVYRLDPSRGARVSCSRPRFPRHLPGKRVISMAFDGSTLTVHMAPEDGTVQHEGGSSSGNEAALYMCMAGVSAALAAAAVLAASHC